MLLVVTVIAILSAAIYPSFSGTQAQGRDAERQTDLRNLAIAIENYKRKEGRYPSQGDLDDGGWSIQDISGTGTEFIQDLFPEYVTTMPKDPLPDSGDGYAYRTNADGTVYKLMARGTVESITVTADHPLAPCSDDLCSCNDEDSAAYQTSFAVWGGFANEADPDEVRSKTADVICEL
jgi:type II secretory pathway pseudopilin PulG